MARESTVPRHRALRRCHRPILGRRRSYSSRCTPPAPSCSAQGCQYFLGDAYARLHGTLHLAVPFRRGLGPCPVKATDGFPQDRPIGGPEPFGPVPAVGAAAPLIVPP